MGYYNKDLNEINFQLFETSEILKPYIYGYWAVKKENFDTSLHHKILSDGCMGISINFKSSYNIKINNTVTKCEEKFIIDGPTKFPSYMSFKEDLEILGVRFKPAGSFVFFDEAIESFVDKTTAIKNSSSWKIDLLYKKLEKCSSVENRIVILEEFFIDKLNNSKKTNATWMFSLTEQIINKKGDVGISSLCEDFNISQRQLERKFKQELGLSPKLYIRIIRLQNAKGVLSSLSVDKLTNTAYNTGFSDQAHFIKEFKFFMNETPKSYYNNKLLEAKSNKFRKYSL